VDYGTVVTKPSDPTRTHSSFVGWYEDAQLTDAWDFTNDTVTADITLYAKWTCDTNYHEAQDGQSCVIDQRTVTFNSNG